MPNFSNKSVFSVETVDFCDDFPITLPRNSTHCGNTSGKV